MNTGIADPRKPWIAVVLSLLCTGLGHIYCGRFAKGITLFAISISTTPLTYLAAICGSATAVLVMLFLAGGLTTVVYLYAVVDSFFVARRTEAEFQRRDYNSGVVYFLFIVLALILPLGTATQIKDNVFEAFKCPARSMVPTIIPGDRFLVNKTVYNPTPPERGAVVVFRNPDDREIMFIKRVIALPGDTVAVTGNEVYVNGVRLVREELPVGKTGWLREAAAGTVYCEINGDRRYLIAIDPESDQRGDFPETVVPRSACFVLGDNRNDSHDSRAFGFVPFGDVVGRAQYIYFPAKSWARFGVIESD